MIGSEPSRLSAARAGGGAVARFGLLAGRNFGGGGRAPLAHARLPLPSGAGAASAAGGGGSARVADGRAADPGARPEGPRHAPPCAVGHRRAAGGAAAVASFSAAVLTEIHLCDICSCLREEILRRNGRGQLVQLAEVRAFSLCRSAASPGRGEKEGGRTLDSSR
jgi:hypothetical protein